MYRQVFHDPITVMNGTNKLTHATSIDASDYVTCAIVSDGASVLSCWGSANLAGRQGDEYSTDQPCPSNLGEFNSVSLARKHGCALKGDEVLCWGRDTKGEVGLASAPSRAPLNEEVHEQTNVLSNAAAVTTGFSHSCALMKDHSVRCWGGNLDGELGIGTTSNTRTSAADATPVNNMKDAVAIAAGMSHTCALRTTGSVACWGAGDEYQMGDGRGGFAKGIRQPIPEDTPGLGDE